MGFDAGKRVNGRKWHIAVDTIGLLLVIAVSAATVQDRVAARALVCALRGCYQRVSCVCGPRPPDRKPRDRESSPPTTRHPRRSQTGSYTQQEE